MTFLFANNARTTLAQSLTATGTSVSLASGEGAQFPSPGTGEMFALFITSASSSSHVEVCYCTARSGDTLTVKRGMDGTTAQSFSAGDYVTHGPVAGVNSLFAQAGNLGNYSASAATDMGGYALNAILADPSTPGLYWRSTVGGNTTAPGQSGSSWANFTGDFLSKTQTAEQDVAGFVKFTGSKGETLQIVNAPPDVPATNVGYNVPNTAWIDEYYATKTALASTTEIANEGVTNAAAAQSSADAAQTTANTGVANAATAQTAAEAAQATADAAVSGGATSGSVKRGETLYLADNGYPSFAYDGGTTQLALLSDLPNGGTGSNGYYIQVRSTLVQQFLSPDITSTAQWVSFPISFAGNPAPPTGNVYGSGDQDTQIYGATESGCYVKCPSGSQTQGQPVSIIVIGPV